MGAEIGDAVEIPDLATALAKAFPDRAPEILLVVEPRLWGLPRAHPTSRLRSHCFQCGRTGEKLFRSTICHRCVVISRAIARSRLRRAALPEPEMAIALAARALRAAGDDRAAELVESVAARKTPTDRVCPQCGAFRGCPREPYEDEECASCLRVRPVVPAMIAGPYRSVCVFCLERAYREVPASRRKLVSK